LFGDDVNGTEHDLPRKPAATRGDEYDFVVLRNRRMLEVGSDHELFDIVSCEKATIDCDYDAATASAPGQRIEASALKEGSR